MAEDLSGGLPQYSVPSTTKGTTKYEHLLAVIDELGKDIKPSYTGNKICSERLKKNIIQARIVIREALLEGDKERQKQAAEALNKTQ